jgi:hypothetical protein
VQVSQGSDVDPDAENLLKLVLHAAQIEQGGVLGGVHEQIEIAILPVFPSGG